MKHELSFSIASERWSQRLVAVAVYAGQYRFVWPWIATQAAVAAARHCGCNRCHNCRLALSFTIPDEFQSKGMDLEFRINDPEDPWYGTTLSL